MMTRVIAHAIPTEGSNHNHQTRWKVADRRVKAIPRQMKMQHRSTIGLTKATIEDDTNHPCRTFKGKMPKLEFFVRSSVPFTRYNRFRNPIYRGQLGGSAFARSIELGKAIFLPSIGKTQFVPAVRQQFSRISPIRPYLFSHASAVRDRIRQLGESLKLRIFAKRVKILVGPQLFRPVQSFAEGKRQEPN